MQNSDFFEILEKLPVPEHRRSTRGYGAVLGLNHIVVQNMRTNPTKGTKDLDVRIVTFFLKLPTELQHYLVQKRLCDDPIENEKDLFEFKHLNNMLEEMKALGMSKMGFYSFLGIRNSVFDHAKERNFVMPNLAFLLETLKYFSVEEKLNFAIEYEVSEKKLKVLKEKLQDFK
ncbi:hypothetical protein F7Q91_03005 [Vibrio chagasii]|uniref:Uncharacterized protein n=1 Tax=Vibrio chagasii TaxID=170679 RepID=A0A7V7NWV2_9VIBR|nr:hypothetical protein [Vibrio chagasii]KAB0482390.1 hypothetical protein F7Q91_03005 [Vibrio chagasii]